MYLFEPLSPFLIALAVLAFRFVRAAGRLARQVIFLAKDEHHDIGILLDRAGFAQIGEHRALVLSLLDRARQLRQSQHRNIELLGERLQPAGDLGNFLNAVVLRAGLARGAQQLQVVDDDQPQALLTLQAPGAGAQRRYRQRRRVVDEQLQCGQTLARLDKLVEILMADIAAPDAVRGNTRFLGENSGGELLRRHFERKEADDRPVLGGLARFGGSCGPVILCCVKRDVGSERRLAH